MRIIKAFLHFLFKTIEVSVALILVVGGLGFGLLYVHPIEIKDYLKTIEKYVLPAESGLKLNADSVTLRAAFEHKGLFHIDITNMTVAGKDNAPILELPNVEFSYNLKHVLTLNYVPSDLQIKNATLYLMIAEDGGVKLYGDTIQKAPGPATQAGIDLSAKESDLVSQIIQKVLSFRSLTMENSTVKVKDKQKNRELSLTETSLYLERQDRLHYALQLMAQLNLQNQKTPVKAEAQLNRFDKKMSFEIEFDTLDLKDLGKDLSFLAGADLVIQGKLKGIFDFGKTCQDIITCFKEGAFQIKTVKAGTLNLPEPLTNLYAIDALVINGAIDSDLNNIKIAKSTVELKGGPTADLQVDVSGIGEFLSKGDLNVVKTTLKADISSLPLSKVPDVWPVATGPDAHAWVKKNIQKGTVQKAEFTLYFTGGELTDLYGELPVTDAEVRYLDEMTPVQGFAGVVKLYPDRVLITGDKGKIWNLNLTGAVIDLTELQDDVSNAKIILDISGPVKEAMALIAEEPLEFPQMFGLDPQKTGGNAIVHTDLAFPLIDDLTTDKVKANVTAKITDGIFPTVFDNTNLKRGQLDLTVDNQKLTLAGTGEIMGLPLNLKWTESFTAGKPTDIQSDYEISSNLTDEKLAAAFPQTTGYIKGETVLKADIKATAGGTVTGNINIDFKKAFLNIYPLSTTKPFDISANLDLTLKQEKGKTDIHYAFKGFADEKSLDPIQIGGQGTFSDLGWEVGLNEVIAPKTNMTASISSNKQGVTLNVKGKSWNAAGLYDLPDNPKEETKPFEFPRNISFDVSLERLILADGKPITTLMGKGLKKDNRWQNLSLNAMAGAPFNLSYLQKKDMVTANTPDIGAFLAHIGVTEKMAKGDLSLSAKQQPLGGFKGEIETKNIVMTEPGFLIQASTILGIVDAIRGKDLLFSEGLVQFELKPDLSLNLELMESYLAGNSLGITFMGNVTGSSLSLTGSVIPAYMINSLPGKIPLIGALFKDSEAGGLIGAKYDIKGKLSNPEVTFHPLNSMAPGILGKIFN